MREKETSENIYRFKGFTYHFGKRNVHFSTTLDKNAFTSISFPASYLFYKKLNVEENDSVQRQHISSLLNCIFVEIFYKLH